MAAPLLTERITVSLVDWDGVGSGGRATSPVPLLPDIRDVAPPFAARPLYGQWICMRRGTPRDAPQPCPRTLPIGEICLSLDVFSLAHAHALPTALSVPLHSQTSDLLSHDPCIVYSPQDPRARSPDPRRPHSRPHRRVHLYDDSLSHRPVRPWGQPSLEPHSEQSGQQFDSRSMHRPSRILPARGETVRYRSHVACSVTR